jgi:hypothetical protein
MKKRGMGKWASLMACSLVFLLSSCLPATQLPPLPTDTPTLTLTSTPTVVWFPRTATATLPPTVIPSQTPELRAGVTGILLEDDFITADHWLTGDMGKGVVALGLNELTLVLTQPKGYLFSFRDEPTFDNFYAEITASTSLCMGFDEYGILIRYNSQVDFYRFSLSCNGQVRLDKLIGGTASSPQPWMASQSVPSAAPSESRLGVWASGSDLRFFINDEFQFAVNDRILPRGMIGVFARSGGETAVTVSFSDLVVYQVGE